MTEDPSIAESVRELVTACLHYKTSGADDDLLLYGDVQKRLMAPIHSEEINVEEVLDELVNLLGTALMRYAQIRGDDPIDLWQAIAQQWASKED